MASCSMSSMAVCMRLCTVWRKSALRKGAWASLPCQLKGSVRGYAVERISFKEIPDCEFRVLIIPGHTKLPEEKKEYQQSRREVPPARYKSMRTDQDWTKVWPAAHTFKWSAVPFPVRQGMVEGEENQGIPPAKYANAELMKIPNFLHLTPAHIKKHCAAIKKYCSEWPAELDTDEKCEEHFPVEVITTDYLTDGASLIDWRARPSTLKVKLSNLDLDYHARDKFLRLVGERYDPATDILTLVSDRCPLKKQNYDYTIYLLSAVFNESWKTEDWESMKAVSDMEKYFWDIMPSRASIVETIRRQKQCSKIIAENKRPAYLARCPDEASEEEIISLPEVQAYKDAITNLHNVSEDIHTLNEYKKAVRKLFLPNVEELEHR